MTTFINGIKNFIYTPDILPQIKKKDLKLLNALQELETTRHELDCFRPFSLRRERETELLQVIRTLAPAWNLDAQKLFLIVNEEFYNFAFASQVTEKGGLIKVSTCFLLKASDLHDFTVDGPTDPRLFDDQFLEQAKNHIEQILEIKNPGRLMIFNKQDLRIFLVMMKDPAKWEEAKLFILGHELEHLRLKHSYDSDVQNYGKEKIIALSMSTALFAWLCVSGTSIPYSLCWTSVAGLVSKWALISWKKWHLTETHELEADNGARDKIKKVDGWNHFLTTIRECNKASRHTSTILSLAFTAKGEWFSLGQLTRYGSFSARLQK